MDATAPPDTTEWRLQNLRVAAARLLDSRTPTWPSDTHTNKRLVDEDLLLQLQVVLHHDQPVRFGEDPAVGQPVTRDPDDLRARADQLAGPEIWSPSHVPRRPIDGEDDQ